MKNIKYPKISDRLRTIANYIEEKSVVADIGTDHGYLPVYIMLKNKVRKVYACDIARKPLLQAKKTVYKYNLADKIMLILSDGLENLAEYKDEIDTIVLAGMGGGLISEIIFKEDWVRKDNINVVIQPMSNYESLRKDIYINGFFIKKEELVLEKKNIYTIMNVGYQGIIRKISDLEAYKGEILAEKKNDKYVYTYFHNRIMRMENRITGLKKTKTRTQDIETKIRKNLDLKLELEKLL